ncbi:hypothetical protein ACSQ67_018544 [Phaseolus vulgaris]
MSTLSSKHSFTNPTTTTVSFLFFAVQISTILASSPHVINFRSPNLFPEGLAWDPTAQHFLVGSLRHRTISAISDAGVVETLVSDPSLPENVSILGLAVDSRNNRVLAALHALAPSLRSTPSPPTISAPAAASSFPPSPPPKKATRNVPSRTMSQRISKGTRIKGYLLVVQTNTGKMFKVDADDGVARLVLLNEDLVGADGVALRNDGVVLVVSLRRVWLLKSNDGWSQGVVFDKIDLDDEGFPTSIVVRERERAYVLHGRMMEGILGNSSESFKIEEVRSPKESEGENVWMYVMVGIGLAYFLFWRFQMKQLVNNMNKKIN